MTTDLLPIEFEAPLVPHSSPYGLEAATEWTETTDPDAVRRWLPSGVQFRQRSYREPGTSGVWAAAWDVAEADLGDNTKAGPPPEDNDPDPFVALTVFASDRLQAGGGLFAVDQAQAIGRLQETFAIREPLEVEAAFTTRALADAGTPTTVNTLTEAVGHLEEAFAATGTFGLIHLRAGLLAVAANAQILLRDSAGVLRSPGGHRFVFGGGYTSPLGDTLIATSQTYGWRDEVTVNSAFEVIPFDAFVVVAERSVVIGYESLIGAAEIS